MVLEERPPAGNVALIRLLDAGQAYAPEYGGGLTNHLPMALAALHRLGAGVGRLDEFASVYARRLEPVTPSDPTPQVSGLPTLANRLPALLPGIGGAAFHGLIRTAYAVESGHTGELAAALAYWSTRCVSLPTPLPKLGERAVEDWLSQVEDRLAGWTSDKRLIIERMLDAALLPAFAGAVDGLKLSPDILQRLSAMAADRYLRTRNFTVLHLITSCHALRVLMPWIAEPDLALRWYALAYAAGWVASGTQPSVAIRVESRPWADVSARAIASADDHVIKLVYTCREEAAHYGDDRYQRVATLAVAG